MRPTFIGIGAQKCASSWLHEMLGDHPQIVVSATKELNFFSCEYEKGFRWYEQQFESVGDVRHAGEISPSYFHEPGVVERIQQYAPNVLIIVSLRDPVERALSQHRHLVRLGLVPSDDLSFETALATNPTYVEQGEYHRHLSRWIGAFGRERVQAILMDDIRRDSGEVLKGLYRFMGVEDDHLPKSLNEARNVSYVIKNPAVDTAVKAVRRTVRAVGGQRLWQSLGDAGLRTAYRAANRAESSSVIPEPLPETLDTLRRRFRPDIEKLAELLEKDLSAWLA